MIVPIWSASWELSCCQPEATQGERWIVPISFNPNPGSLWSGEFDVSVADDQRTYGIVDLDVERLASPPNVFASGPLRFHAPSELTDGRRSGTLFVDAHCQDQEQVLSGGMVTAVDLVPIRYNLGEHDGRKMYRPTARLEPQRVKSTLERAQLDDSIPYGESMVQAELLVWVEVEDLSPKEDP